MGQARRLRRVHDGSGLPPAPERLRHYSEPTLRARKRHDQRYGRGYGRGMKLVFIHGAPAAGKLTTARALLALVNGRLCSVMKLRAPCSEAIFFLESVSKLDQGLQSFRSMRRMEASFKNARALRLRFSQSLARRRQRLSHAMVRSTIQRLGNCTNPLA